MIVTPLHLRLAWNYAKQGVGTYYIAHKEYDHVVVSELYPWTVLDNEGQGCLKVAFYRGDKQIRYVEFGTRVVGAGGEPLVREVT